MPPTDITEGRATVNGVDIAYLHAGEGPLALCLHGFPDSAWTWRLLLPELAAAGFHAVAPFLRGYAPSGLAPDGIYQAGAYAADANALHQALGGGPDAVLVGHDWGAIAAYPAVNDAPDRWSRLAALAVPPQDAVIQTFLRYDQLKASFYIFLFQHPLAELAVQTDDLAFVDGLWADWSPGWDGSWYVEKAKESLRPPGAVDAALRAYRSMIGDGPRGPAYDAVQAHASGPVARPTLYLHGAHDGCLLADGTGPVADFLPAGSQVGTVDGAGHFLHLERPEHVNRLIIDFLTERHPA